jgi:hypothetical protein
MRSSLLARELLVGLALSTVAVPAALADGVGATATEETITTTETTTTETTTATTTAETTTTSETTRTETTPTETTTTEPATQETAPHPWAETADTRRLRARALRYRAAARRWRALMGQPRPYLLPRAAPFESLLAKRRWQARKWRAKRYWARRAGHHPPHRAAWLCIHRYEGAWRDPNAPYYGGLQMDLVFQRTYGRRLLRRRGTADHWTRFEQMWVAERALRTGRGFAPWPLTARYCGLI